MLIQYVGLAGIREVREYQWKEGNGYVADVDAQTAAELLTYPRPDFCLSRDEPLLALDGMTTLLATELALYGIGSIEAMAKLSPAASDQLSERISVNLINAWVEQAQAIVNGLPAFSEPAESEEDGPEGQEE